MPTSHSLQLQSFEHAMSKALAMVRRHLNSHNPTIRKIPSEILIMIASHLKADATLITKATHVCHHWRATLLSCPALWTHPDFSRGNQALSFLDRSKLSPIHLDLKNTALSDSLVDLLCQHATRVDTLKINRCDRLQKLFHLPMASLKTLEVVTPDNWFFTRSMRLEAREFPALTSLTIEHNPGALAFRGSLITHLRVSTSNLHHEITYLPDLLRSCALLERLEIENRGDLENSLQLLPDEVIPLPHLRTFTQTLHHDRHTPGIINELDLPPSCSIVLRCIAGPTNGHPPLDLPALRNTSYFTNPKRLKVVYAGECLGGDASFTLDLVNDRGTRFTATTEFTNFAVSFTPQHSEHPKDDRIEHSMPGVEVLCVGGYRYVSIERFRSLTTLILSGSVIHLYLEFLAGPKGRYVYENLQKLVLFVVRSRFAPTPVRHLPDVARIRAETGLPLRMVTFASPSVLSAIDLMLLEEVRAYVERVDLLLGNDALDWNLDKYYLN